jgi:hypothetical protein
MPSWDDVVRIALDLPQVGEATWYRTPALKVAGKGFARLRAEAEGLLVLLVPLEEKEALLQSGDPAYTTLPHYDGYAAILIDLEAIGEPALREAVRLAWLHKAPAKLRRGMIPPAGAEA